ncbi:hypothetical protein LDG_7989 [Legionella drancourtii LLAP12]|uniref:Uncharacterized protein n=2 Tax=Legionella drancourtii TaxID=168933 RepID=G9ERS1_9GAMM|nr:hypothetical protein LDG_7989 [Legionella drancourtii LLAP12]
MIWSPLITILDEKQLNAIPSICLELHSAIMENNEMVVKEQIDRIAAGLGISV